MALLRPATSSDLGPVIQSDRVLLRTPQMSDYPDWAELRAASCEFLTPWEPLWAAAEEEYRKAQSAAERFEILERMLVLIPKHKGTEKLQADLKTKLKETKVDIQV